MKYQETDLSGSFTALGTGVLYEYNARLKSLHISRAGSFQELLQLKLHEPPLEDAFEFIRLFEKTTQIKALKFSNNGTINIAETLDDSLLPPILQRAFRISLYAFHLEKEKFDDFQRGFLTDHELNRIEVRKLDGHASAPFYLAYLETRRGNCVTVRSSNLHGAMTYLADKVMQDIIAKEFSYHVDSWVHKLLNTASVLSTLSFVLNQRFDPVRKTAGKTPSLLARLPVIRKSIFNSIT